MNEYNEITFNNLPEAVMHLLQEVTYIKNHLLNERATTAEPTLSVPEKEIMTVAEVSQFLNLSKGAIYNMCSDREIPFYKRGKRNYFDRKEIDEWMREGRRKTEKQLHAEAEMETRKK